MPTLSSPPTSNSISAHPYAHGAEAQSPPASAHPFAIKQRGVYEQLLDCTPGIVRQGEGWSSRGLSTDEELVQPPKIGRRMGKTSSMLSLREKARAFLGVPAPPSNLNTTTNTGSTYHTHAGNGNGEGEGSKRESKGKMVQWSQSTTTILSPAHASNQHAPGGGGGSIAQRPGTPSAASTLMASSRSTSSAAAAAAVAAGAAAGAVSAVEGGQTKKKGLFKSLRWGKNHD